MIERAKSNRFFSQASPILFIDEIHRFSKSQQDSLLGAVEQGTVTLIGATTENPSFEVIRPLLSRCQLYTLKSLEKDDLLELLQRAITTDTVLKERKIELKETTAMLRFSGGDARKLLNILELVIDSEAPTLSSSRMTGDRTPSTEPSCLRQGRRDALRHHLRFHQIHSRQRPGWRHLLAGTHGRRR